MTDSRHGTIAVCGVCKRHPSGDIDSIRDAVRIGEEALEKATALELHGTLDILFIHSALDHFTSCII